MEYCTQRQSSSPTSRLLQLRSRLELRPTKNLRDDLPPAAYLQKREMVREELGTDRQLHPCNRQGLARYVDRENAVVPRLAARLWTRARAHSGVDFLHAVVVERIVQHAIKMAGRMERQLEFFHVGFMPAVEIVLQHRSDRDVVLRDVMHGLTLSCFHP